MAEKYLTAYQLNNMDWKQDKTSKNNVNYIPSYTSPRGGRRACLCWETNTYSIECCDGSLHAQGIGRI